jgi:cell division protein FtsB
LEEDPVYLEKVAREKMGLIKKGEVVYQLVPAESEQ